MTINSKERNKKIYLQKIFDYLTIALVILAHLGILTFVLLSSRYYALELKIFVSTIMIIILLFIILDIIFYIALRHQDKILQIISLILAIILFLGSSIASFYVYKINNSVNQILDNSGDEQYETINGTFVSYKKTFNSLEELNGKKVGILFESSVGTGSLGQEELKNKNIESLIVEFKTMDDLLFGLIGDDVDCAIFPSSYRQRYANDDNVDFEQFLDDLYDFYNFEKQIKTGENAGKNINLAQDPFNILLIGFAPETADNSYGLADSIIVATVNPRNMVVSLTSIARDSYVPISCYGGAKDKINAARGNSRACLMNTVSDLLDIDIDLYMEVNFQGIVDIVDALGGLDIYSEVEFIGQSPSVNRGQYWVWVPQGWYHASGEQVLAFARERHAFPDGDFARQKHQQEVIMSIAKELINLNDVNAALKVMEAAGNNISTNLSLSQLTGIFNYILNAKNYTTYPISEVIKLDSMRITGYASYTYNYAMRLPLWIYKLYDGSIKEAKEHIELVLGKTDKNGIEQDKYHRHFSIYPYYPPETLYSLYFDEPQIHEKMPDFVPYLTKYSYQEALAWANSKGVKLDITYIKEGEAGYNAKEAGRVVAQNPRQGALVAEYPVVSITVMGVQDEQPLIVECNDIVSCKLWAQENGVTIVEEFADNDGSHKAGDFAYTSPKEGKEIGDNNILIIFTYGDKKPEEHPDKRVIVIELDCDGNEVKRETRIISYGNEDYDKYTDGQEIRLAAQGCKPVEHTHNYDSSITKEPTCSEKGIRTYTCSCGNTYIEDIDALGHNYELISETPATCESDGERIYRCTRCGDEYHEVIPQLTGDSCNINP